MGGINNYVTVKSRGVTIRVCTGEFGGGGFSACVEFVVLLNVIVFVTVMSLTLSYRAPSICGALLRFLGL